MNDCEKQVAERIAAWAVNIDKPTLEVKEPVKVIRDPEWYQRKLKPLKQKEDITVKKRDDMRKKLISKYKNIIKDDSLLPLQIVEEIEPKIFKKASNFTEYQTEMNKIMGFLLFQIQFVDYKI